MEELLAIRYKIKTVQFLDSNLVERKYSFTSKMLINDIFIEHYTIDTSDEEGNERDCNDDLEGNFRDAEYGSQLSVILKKGNKYYQFVLYDDCWEIGAPILLLQTILFMVTLIEELDPSELVKYLMKLSTDTLIPHEISDKMFRDLVVTRLMLTIKTVHNLVEEGKVGHS